MFFSSPLWLVGLVPWAGVTLWLLLGRRRRVTVPFVELWKGPTDGPRAKPSLIRPPLFVLLAILSLLLAILAAARPMRSTRGPRVTLILDRGITMVLRDGDAVDPLLFQALENRLGKGSLKIITVPATPSVPDRATTIYAISQSLISTDDLLPPVVRQQLEDSSDLVVVNTDQFLNINNPRLLVIPPLPPKPHPALVDLAARADPKPQVMVRFRDVSSPASISLESAGHREERAVSPSAEEQTIFIDMPALGREVFVGLLPFSFSLDSSAWLARESAAARIVGYPGLPEQLRRMVEVYGRHRPTGDAQVVLVVTDSGALPVDKPAVLLSDVPSGLGTAGSPAIVQDHPLTNEVKFPPDTGTRPPPGWQSIVSSGDTTLVAVKDGPPRQVWVCLNDPAWAATPNYVIFWTNVFDWLGGGKSEYRWHPMNEWFSADVGDHVPGIFRQTDGTQRAFNAIGIPLPPIQQTDWRKRLDEMLKTGGASTDLTPLACIAALLLVTSAIGLSRLAFSSRTFRSG